MAKPEVKKPEEIKKGVITYEKPPENKIPPSQRRPDASQSKPKE